MDKLEHTHPMEYKATVKDRKVRVKWKALQETLLNENKTRIVRREG